MNPPKVDLEAIVENSKVIDEFLGCSTFRPETNEPMSRKPSPVDLVNIYAALQVSPYF